MASSTPASVDSHDDDDGDGESSGHENDATIVLSSTNSNNSNMTIAIHFPDVSARTLELALMFFAVGQSGLSLPKVYVQRTPHTQPVSHHHDPPLTSS